MEIIPLRVTARAKKYLTKKAYEKNKGKFGSMIYIFEKRKEKHASPCRISSKLI